MAKLRTVQIHLAEQHLRHLDAMVKPLGIRRSEYIRRLVDNDREAAEARAAERLERAAQTRGPREERV